MASTNGGPAVLYEAREVRLVAAITKVGLGERDVGELEVFGSFGESEGRAAQGASEVEVVVRPRSGACGGEERRRGRCRIRGGVGGENGDDAFLVAG